MKDKPHHTILRTCATLYNHDRLTEWWTVTNENRFYDIRDSLPFDSLFVGPQGGGIIVYLDKPKAYHKERERVEAEEDGSGI